MDIKTVYQSIPRKFHTQMSRAIEILGKRGTAPQDAEYYGQTLVLYGAGGKQVAECYETGIALYVTAAGEIKSRPVEII